MHSRFIVNLTCYEVRICLSHHSVVPSDRSDQVDQEANQGSPRQSHLKGIAAARVMSVVTKMV